MIRLTLLFTLACLGPTATILAETPPISLEISAEPANWDRDVETDGLRLYVWPLDAQGRLVAVRGQLRVELSAPSHGPAWRDLPKNTLETWTVQIKPQDFEMGRPAVVQLPYRRRHPQFNLDIASAALATATLGINGRGVLSASDANVYLRPLSRYHDELQL
jgi:hypothetical protein